MNYLIVALFGFLGGNLRYFLGMWIPKIGDFPLPTLAINLLGCFLFTFLAKNYLVSKKASERLILGVGTGFVGSLTTFSSFALDVNALLLVHQYGAAFLYAAISLLGGLLFVYLGTLVRFPSSVRH
ncbi:chromosome condensation protein CrcB [Enterococcus canis]|uniref:Fluoride-specific ion channel FluC n=1 Tax=Enterococcus canis TaxID=214095 RepID=A0A1L8RIK1_9ENTE|nr:CrcB family protein [Enterococcus canis]OJG19600.1 chromosome condensation protein CrcB [Enterococcus canis]